MKKTAFVSGASRGIGAAVARALAEEGYHLALTCEKNQTLLNELASHLRETYHVEVCCYTGDMGDSGFVADTASDILCRWGSVDLVVNNAGIAHIGLLTDMTPQEWDRILSVNLSSCFYTAKAFVPSMVARRQGHLIQISSMWGSTGASCEVAYSASKGGMNAFTKALARELAPSGVRVNAIACGVIDTEMNHVLSDGELDRLREEIPAGRLGTPAEVADCLCSLLKSPSYLTGQIIGLDGGYC